MPAGSGVIIELEEEAVAEVVVVLDELVDEGFEPFFGKYI
jgi:hypothetical protein